VKPAPFRYERPSEVDEAVALLAEHGGEAKVLAGGQSLMPLMNMRLARPAVLVDITRIASLDSIEVDDGHLVVGAAARARDAELSPAVRERCPMLAESLRWVGHVEIRNRGTVCGSLAHADPVAELPLVAVTLDAELVARSARGKRTIAASDFFVSYLTTALAEDELLTSVRLPVRQSGVGWGFVEFARRHGDYALVAVAALLEGGPDGVCTRARLVLGGVDATPLRARVAERALVGQCLDGESFAAAAREVVQVLNPESDVQASGEYRRKLAGVLVERALAEAADRLPKEG
jgi:CO/xanthine dehydrogenase FAD-binding subunit